MTADLASVTEAVRRGLGLSNDADLACEPLAENEGLRSLYRFRGQAADGSALDCVAKRYSDESGARAYGALVHLKEQLQRLGEGATTPLRIPRPLHYEPALRLLVMETAPGRPVSPRPGTGLDDDCEAAGRALAALHRIARPLPPGAGSTGRPCRWRACRPGSC